MVVIRTLPTIVQPKSPISRSLINQFVLFLPTTANALSIRQPKGNDLKRTHLLPFANCGRNSSSSIVIPSEPSGRCLTKPTTMSPPIKLVGILRNVCHCPTVGWATGTCNVFIHVDILMPTATVKLLLVKDPKRALHACGHGVRMRRQGNYLPHHHWSFG